MAKSMENLTTPKLNRAQLRAFARWTKTPEGKRAVKRAKAAEEAKSARKREMEDAARAAMQAHEQG